MLDQVIELIQDVLKGQDASDVVRNEEQRSPGYEDNNRALANVEQNTRKEDATTGHTTQASWTNVASLDISGMTFSGDGSILHWKNARPYVIDTSGGGKTTDARLLAATDKRKVAGDAPTGALSDGDGFQIVDDVSGMSSGGDWPDIITAYEVDTHLLVLQVQEGSGSETVDALLTADREQ